MYKIGVIELKCAHHEVAVLCKYSNPEKNEITLFTTHQLLPRILQELKKDAFLVKYCIKDEKESHFSFIRRVNKICNYGFDLVIINTMRRWEMIFFRPNCRKLGYLYNINFWIRDLTSPQIILKNIFTFSRSNLISLLPSKIQANPYFGPFIRFILLKMLDGILVEYPPFTNLIKHTYNYKKPVYFLPKRYFEKSTNNFGNSKITFAITGTISDNRRNYDIVLDAIKDVPDRIKSKLKLALIGRPIGEYGYKIIERVKNLIANGWEIDYSDEYIPPDVMTQKLQAVDVMIAPMKFTYTSITVNESFTYTKGTGTFNDAIRYGIPSIVPDEYNIAPEFKSCFLKYQDQNDLSRIISELSTNTEELNKLKVDTLNTMKDYTLPKVQEMLKNIIADYVNK